MSTRCPSVRLIIVAAAVMVAEVAVAGTHEWTARWPRTSIEFQASTWRAAPDAQVKGFATAVDTGDRALNAELRRLLSTPAGKLELDRRLELAQGEVWRREAVRAISARMAGKPGVAVPRGDDGSAALFTLLSNHASLMTASLRELEALLRRIRNGLPRGAVLEGRLSRLLDRPQASAAILVADLYPATIPHPLKAEFGNWFRRRPDGRFVVFESRRKLVAAHAEKLVPALRAVKQLHGSLGQMAARMAEEDALSRRVKRLLAEPAYAAVGVLVAFARAPEATSDQLAQGVIASVLTNLTESAGRLRLKPGADRTQIAAASEAMEGLLFATRAARARLEPYLARVDAALPAERRMRDLMASDLGALSTILEAASMPLEERFLLHTTLGSAVLRTGKSWHVNTKRKTQMVLQLEFLEELLDAYESIAREVGGAQPDASGPELVARFAELAVVAARTRSEKPDPWGQWVTSRFVRKGSRLVLRAGARPEIRKLVEDMQATETQIAAHEPAIAADLRGARFDDARVHLLRSSALFNPRTTYGNQAYLSGFDDHYAASIWGVFEYPAVSAKNRADFTRQLVQKIGRVLDAAPVHKKIIIGIYGTPQWLRADRGASKHVQGKHGPKDWKGWTDVVRETVRLVKQVKGPQRYYEVWNEPGQLWAADTKAKLRLYAETVKAIRAEDPQAKVGGSAVNQWTDRVGGAKGGDPLNLELLRYVSRNGLPLDFISWHQFGARHEQIEKARSTFVAEAERLGLRPTPEMVVTEWSPPNRDTVFEAISFAEIQLGLYRAGVDFHLVSGWEEFSQIPMPKSPGPWGLVTRQAQVKSMVHVHSFFDRLSRGSKGVAVFESKSGTTKVVASRKGAGVYELVLWEAGLQPRMEAAVKVLSGAGFVTKDSQDYVVVEALDQAIRTATPIHPKHRDAFKRAREAHENHPHARNLVHLEVPGAGDIEVLESAAVGRTLVVRPARAAGGRIVVDLRRNEVA